ncbi:FAD-linked sulfhydryl oxidase ERV1 [Citrus sinensis]|nr:FAD-linked sulfhydryl oxidase ERV1 [Citrus sinensis]
MAENHPLQALFVNFQKVTNCIQTHLSNFIDRRSSSSSSQPANGKPLLFLSPSINKQNNPSSSNADSAAHQILLKETSAPVTKDELGRATWTFLHTLAAQMAILSRMYPCKECADHFKEVLRANPVQAGSHDEFSQWLCHVHNVVNRSLGKLVFPCERVDARWGKLECEQRACDLQGTPDLGE